MYLKGIAKKFLAWEDEEKLYSYKINDLPIYLFIRNELYGALLFGSDPLEGFKKSEVKTSQKANYFDAIKNSILFLLKLSRLYKKTICVSHVENRVNGSGVFYNRFFARILDFDTYALEYPNADFVHKKPIPNRKKVIKADLLYGLELVFKKRYNKSKLLVQIAEITSEYLKLYNGITNTTVDRLLLEKVLLSRIERNIQRSVIYDLLFRYVKPTRLFLKSAYTPLSQLQLFCAAKYNFDTFELQHGHIYPLHIGYLLPLNQANHKYFPKNILVWSNFYKQTLLEAGWPKNRIINTGDFVLPGGQKEQNKSNKLKTIRNNYGKVVLLVSQHTLMKEFMGFLENIDNVSSDVCVLIKLHPKYQQQQFEKFQAISNKKNVRILFNEDINSCFQVSDLVVGSYSTAIIEAIEQGKKVQLINSTASQLFNDLIERQIVSISSSILESVKQMGNIEPVEELFRENLKEDLFQEIISKV